MAVKRKTRGIELQHTLRIQAYPGFSGTAGGRKFRRSSRTGIPHPVSATGLSPAPPQMGRREAFEGAHRAEKKSKLLANVPEKRSFFTAQKVQRKHRPLQHVTTS